MNIKNQIGQLLVKGIAKAFGLGQLAHLWDTGGDLTGETDSKARKPYKQVSLVYKCVNEIISSIQSLPLVLSTIDERIIESGPVYELLFNSEQSWQDFVEQTIGHYALSRDVFWLFVDEDGFPASGLLGSKIAKIVVVSGSQMRPLTDTGTSRGELIGWQLWGLSGKQITFTVNECHQWKNFNPYDKFHGLGPMTAAENDINYDYAASLYNASALANGTEPGPIITMQGNPAEDQVRAFLSKFESRHQGAGKAKRAVALTGGADIKTIAQSLADLEVAKITELTDKKICSAFGVPPGVAGLITEAQYSHGPAMQQFIFNTVIPLANIFSGQITRGIVRRFTSRKSAASIRYKQVTGRTLKANRFYRDCKHRAVSSQDNIFAWFDSSSHPTVQEHDRDVAEKILKFTASGVPLNNLIEAHDLPYEQTEAGKYWWTGMGQVPADYILEAGMEGITGPSLPEGGEEPKEVRVTNHEPQVIKGDEQQRLRIWRNWVISWAGIEREFTQAMRMLFVRQQRILTEKLKAALEENRSVKANPEDVITRVVFDMQKENGKIRVINQTFFEKASELGIRQSLVETLGLKGDELSKLTAQIKKLPAIKGKLIISTSKIAKVNNTTQELIARQLKEGLEAGENLNQLTERIKNTMGSNRARAQRIARTQTAGAVGTGRHNGMKAAGTELKSWLTSRDNNVRSSHKDAEAKYSDGISLDQPFEVGGELLMYPGDPSGSPANIINCRCVELAKAAAGKTFELSHYSKFYSYSNMQEDLKNEN